jgi:hypothetical protein
MDMTEAKRPLKVFLCYAHADRDPVRGLYARLTQHIRKRTPTRNRRQKRTPSAQIRESVIESVGDRLGIGNPQGCV